MPPGHTLALTHGARSPRVYLPLAEELVAGLLEHHPDLTGYPAAVARWGEWEARAQLLRRHLAEIGDLDDQGEPRTGLLSWLKACESAAERSAALLSLDPRSEAALARERAAAGVLTVNLSAIAQAGRDAIARRDAAGLPGPVDLAGEVLERVSTAGADLWRRAVEEHAADDLGTDHDQSDQDHDQNDLEYHDQLEHDQLDLDQKLNWVVIVVMIN